jgi:hypothetical protein
MSTENIEISLISELPDGIPRQGARRDSRRCLRESALAAGDRRRGQPSSPAGEPEMRGQSRHLEFQWAPLPPPIPVGPAGVAEIQSDQMDITLVPLPLVIEPAAACAIMFHSQ